VVPSFNGYGCATSWVAYIPEYRRRVLQFLRDLEEVINSGDGLGNILNSFYGRGPYLCFVVTRHEEMSTTRLAPAAFAAAATRATPYRV